MNMVRGIHRKVIEIADADSAYFERVLFFLKDSDKIHRENVDTLRARAEEYLLSRCGLEYKKSRLRTMAVRCAALLGAAVAGGLFGFFVL